MNKAGESPWGTHKRMRTFVRQEAVNSLLPSTKRPRVAQTTGATAKGIQVPMTRISLSERTQAAVNHRTKARGFEPRIAREPVIDSRHDPDKPVAIRVARVVDKSSKAGSSEVIA